MIDFLDLIYPRTCAICGRPADRPGRHLCSSCMMRLPFLPTDGLCRRCGRHAVALSGDFLCEDCRSHKPGFDRTTSVWSFEGDGRELVNTFKFRSGHHLKSDFVDILEARARTYFKVDEIACVVPIPSTFLSRWMRGFTPACVLAEGLAKRLGKPCRKLLKRVGHPKRQGRLSEVDRRTNVVGTFAAVSAQTASPVLLVDDIMTTGSTLSEAAKTLKSAGVKTIWAISLARSVHLD